jgi:hypothetical protein
MRIEVKSGQSLEGKMLVCVVKTSNVTIGGEMVIEAHISTDEHAL